MRRLISLGYKCETAFQLRMHTGDASAQFFDWMMAPQVQSIVDVLDRDFDVFAPEHLGISVNRAGDRNVKDMVTGLSLPHAFPKIGRHVAADFMIVYGDFLARMRHLAARLRQSVAEGPVTFVRRRATVDEAEALERAVFRRFPAADARFLYVADHAFTTAHGHARSGLPESAKTVPESGR